MQWPARSCEPRGVVPNRGGAEPSQVHAGKGWLHGWTSSARSTHLGEGFVSLNVCAHTGGAGAQ